MAFRITVDVPDPVASRVEAAFTAAYGYQAQIPDPAFEPTPENPGPAPMIDNPETPTDFVKAQIREHIRNVVAGHEATEAAEKARGRAADKARGEVLA